MNAPCPTEIKAQAVAMMCLGYSARRTERALRAKYPGADIPRYSTISRWLSSSEVAHMAKRSVRYRWALVLRRSQELVLDMMDELDRAPPQQLLKSHRLIWQMYELADRLS